MAPHGEPVGPGALDPLLDAALGIDGADAVEAAVRRSWGGLTRFARSAIHQHVATEDAVVSVRVVVDGRVGTASTNDDTPAGAASAAARALAAARLTPQDPTYAGLAEQRPLPDVGRRFDPATASATPAQRATAVAELIARLHPG